MSNRDKIPDFQTLMLPMLKLLANGRELSLNEVVESLSSQYKLTEEDLKIKVPSGQMGLFKNRVGWTRSYLKKAGLIKYPKRGTYQITELGSEFLATSPTELRAKHLKEMPLFKDWTETFGQSTNSTESLAEDLVTDNSTPDEVLAKTINRLNLELASEILDKLKENSFEYFEDFVIKLLQKMGYGEFREESGERTGKSGDNGIDGIIYQDRLGLESVYIQAKRFKDGTVGSPDIRNFIGSLAIQGVTKGVFLTTSRFSSSAKETANNSKQQKIVLIDGKKLADLAIEFNLGVQTEDTISIKKIDTDFFEEYE